MARIDEIALTWIEFPYAHRCVCTNGQRLRRATGRLHSNRTTVDFNRVEGTIHEEC